MVFSIFSGCNYKNGRSNNNCNNNPNFKDPRFKSIVNTKRQILLSELLRSPDNEYIIHELGRTGNTKIGGATAYGGFTYINGIIQTLNTISSGVCSYDMKLSGCVSASSICCLYCGKIINSTSKYHIKSLVMYTSDNKDYISGLIEHLYVTCENLQDCVQYVTRENTTKERKGDMQCFSMLQAYEIAWSHLQSDAVNTSLRPIIA